ncbi:MAG: nuclear transport factor 2 family protein [Anaerolineae bacterium]|jgi:ketosteroid isomerase-like protein
MKKSVIAVSVVVVMLALPVVLYAQETDPLAIVNSWLEALNAGDVDAALSYLADDAQITSDQVYTGKEEIRGWYEAQVEANGASTLSDCQVDGETVTCISSYTDDGLQAMGVDFLEGELVLVVRDGKIQSYTFAMSPESLAKLPPPPEILAETGGGSLASYPWVMALGGLVVAGGLLITTLGLGLKRRSGASQ